METNWRWGTAIKCSIPPAGRRSIARDVGNHSNSISNTSQWVVVSGESLSDSGSAGAPLVPFTTGHSHNNDPTCRACACACARVCACTCVGEMFANVGCVQYAVINLNNRMVNKVSRVEDRCYGTAETPWQLSLRLEEAAGSWNEKRRSQASTFQRMQAFSPSTSSQSSSSSPSS